MNDKQSEIHLYHPTGGWQPRINPNEVDDKQSEIRTRYLGMGVACGSSFGLAIGAGLGFLFSDLAIGIGFGISVGVGLGITVGSALGNKHANAVQEPSDTDGNRIA